MDTSRVEEAMLRCAEIDSSDTGISLRSVLALDADACQRTSDVSERDGLLAGVPVLVKDNIEAVGLPCTAGSLAMQGLPVQQDSTVAARLRRAGAVIIGAANLSEWANIRSSKSSSGWSGVGGLVANPWVLDRSAGGSSSGSGAAVAAHIVPMAVGTETDGSITCPAALNGVVGIKPTVGVIPTDGIVPVSGSQDTPGPLARSIDDAEVMLAVLSDDMSLLTRSRDVDVSSVSIGVVDSWRTGDAPTDAVFDDVVKLIQRMTRKVSSSAMPTTPDEVHADEFTVLIHELRTDLDSYLAGRSNGERPTSIQDIIDFNNAHHEEELRHFGQDIFEMAAQSSGRSSTEYVNARQRNVQWARHVFDNAFGHHNVLIAPAYVPAWKTDFALGHPQAGGAVTTPAAIAGLPIVTIPMGLVSGLPVGLSIVGGKNSEAMLIAVARHVEGLLGLISDQAWRPQFTPRLAE